MFFTICLFCFTGRINQGRKFFHVLVGVGVDLLVLLNGVEKTFFHLVFMIFKFFGIFVNALLRFVFFIPPTIVLFTYFFAFFLKFN